MVRVGKLNPLPSGGLQMHDNRTRQAIKEATPDRIIKSSRRSRQGIRMRLYGARLKTRSIRYWILSTWKLSVGGSYIIVRFCFRLFPFWRFYQEEIYPDSDTPDCQDFWTYTVDQKGKWEVKYLSVAVRYPNTP